MATTTLPQRRRAELGSAASDAARDCIDLEEHFGGLYRVQYEESYTAQYGPRARVNEPSLKIIPCRNGHIYSFGGSMLAASVDGHRRVANRVRRLPCCRVYQDGDGGELTVLFDVADFAEVAEVMVPRRRRQLTKAELERLQAIGRQTQFAPNHGVQSELRRAKSTQAHWRDSEGHAAPIGHSCPCDDH